jgi:hypothetical protein
MDLGVSEATDWGLSSCYPCDTEWRIRGTERIVGDHGSWSELASGNDLGATHESRIPRKQGFPETGPEIEDRNRACDDFDLRIDRARRHNQDAGHPPEAERLTRSAEWRELATGTSRSRIERSIPRSQIDAANGSQWSPLRHETRLACKRSDDGSTTRAKRSIVDLEERLWSIENPGTGHPTNRWDRRTEDLAIRDRVGAKRRSERGEQGPQGSWSQDRRSTEWTGACDLSTTKIDERSMESNQINLLAINL